MAKLKIVKVGDEVLRKQSRPVADITPRIKRLLDDMKETMRAADGCGLAAPQVGILRRICVIEVGDDYFEMINPEIIETDGKQNEAEGCLSVPGEWGITERPMTVTVKYLDRNGEECVATGSELLARAFCHEIDHLDGILFTDKVIEKLEEK